jgi:hypothetical protein
MILTQEERAEAFEYLKRTNHITDTEQVIKENMYENFLIQGLINKRKEEAAKSAENSIVADLQQRVEAEKAENAKAQFVPPHEHGEGQPHSH